LVLKEQDIDENGIGVQEIAKTGGIYLDLKTTIANMASKSIIPMDL
jgi:hypothetical protein